MNRRHFIQSAFYSGMLYGSGALPKLVSDVNAAPLANNILVNLELNGGPDFRHFIVPEYTTSSNSFGFKYWKHRARSHRISTTNRSTWQRRWNNDYYHITVGAGNWSGGLVDSGGLNNGVTFGIWKEAGWLIDMFKQGNVAIVCNAAGGTNFAHDLSSLMLNQGNLQTDLNNRDYSGWGGRLARSTGGNLLSVTNTPRPFCFGPLGNAPSYNAAGIDNRDLVSVDDSREIGLFDHDLDLNQNYQTNSKLARSAKSYYAALRQEQTPQIYDRFMDHEQKVREFGDLIRGRLDTIPEPDLIRALYDYNGVPGINVSPSTGNPRRVLSGYGFGEQIRNLHDVIVSNDLLATRVVSMVGYNDWDSHAEQRIIPQGLAADPYNPDLYRGVESSFRNLFGGKLGNNPTTPNALHSGFSALWQSLPQADLDKIVMVCAGEFGRQIRDNGDAGTDHGIGNVMMVIGEQVSGGIYGEMFPDDEVDKYDDPNLFNAEIDKRTDIEPIFSAACNWVQPNSGNTIFPRMNNVGNTNLPDEQVPDIENGISLANLI